MLMHHGCDCFEYTRRYLKNEGYKIGTVTGINALKKA